jgi:hypothetical protein
MTTVRKLRDPKLLIVVSGPETLELPANGASAAPVNCERDRNSDQSVVFIPVHREHWQMHAIPATHR